MYAVMYCLWQNQTIMIMGLYVRKPVSGGFRTTQAQTSLRIRAVLSAPLFFAYWKLSYIDLLKAKFQFSR